MIQNHFLLAAQISLVAGCAAAPARFETSDTPRTDIMDEPPLAAYQVPVQSPADPRYQLEMTTARFLLALENRAPERLEALLLPDATVREHASGSASPALPALLELSSGWSEGPSLDAASGSGPLPPFGPAKVVELQTQGSEGWATVEVDGPPKVRGLWKVRLGNAYRTPQVAEVILPKNQ